MAPATLTREVLLPALKPLGISRVSDLTGLDHLGVPVWAAIRPNARSLCVSNGKALTHEAAWVSAVMESAEHALAEEPSSLVEVVASETDLVRQGYRPVPLARQARCAAERLHRDVDRAWVRGIDWQTSEPVFAPYEMIGLDMTVGAPWDSVNFRMSSLGLAASGDISAAILHALRELVEEDAIFGPLAGGVSSISQNNVVRFRLPYGQDLQRLVARLYENGIEACFSVCRSDIDMPVVIAGLRPLNQLEARGTYFGGSACRDTVESAALAALLEAVQSRLTFISGTRDDLLEDEYGRLLKSGTDTLLQSCNFGEGPINETAADNEALEQLIVQVTNSGERSIYVFPLGGRSLGFDVVRVLADDLLTLQGPSHYRAGARAAGKLLRPAAGTTAAAHRQRRGHRAPVVDRGAVVADPLGVDRDTGRTV